MQRRHVVQYGAAGAGALALMLGVGWWRVDGPGAPKPVGQRPLPLSAMDFRLTDHEGNEVGPETLIGRPTMVFFGFTYCPDVCPTTLSDISGWLEDLGDDAARVLEAYVSPVVNDQMDHGWEEWTDASVTSLLKTRLAKNAARDGDDGAERERAPGGGARRPAPMTDTSKLKKHISVVCERLARGGTLA